MKLKTGSCRCFTLQKYEDILYTVPHYTACYRMLLHRTFSYRFLLHYPSLSDSESDMERIWNGYVSDNECQN